MHGSAAADRFTDLLGASRGVGADRHPDAPGADCAEACPVTDFLPVVLVDVTSRPWRPFRRPYVWTCSIATRPGAPATDVSSGAALTRAGAHAAADDLAHAWLTVNGYRRECVSCAGYGIEEAFDGLGGVVDDMCKVCDGRGWLPVLRAATRSA